MAQHNQSESRSISVSTEYDVVGGRMVGSGAKGIRM